MKTIGFHIGRLDIEIKLLCFSVGFRLIWIKTKRNY